MCHKGECCIYIQVLRFLYAIRMSHDSRFIVKKQKENNSTRLETLADTDEYLEHLEENLGKIQEMKRVTDLKSSEGDSIQSTQRRIGELQEIRELLDGEESSSTKGGIELRDEAAYSAIEDRRSTFLESLKVQVEPSIPTRYEEDIYPNDVEHTRPELIRIYVFFYDPQASWQKPHVENNHKLIRRIIPKGTSSMSRTHDLFAVISAVPYVTTLMAKHHLI